MVKKTPSTGPRKITTMEESVDDFMPHISDDMFIALSWRIKARKDEERLQDLLAYVKAEGRICPQPIAWDKLWLMLPDRRRDGASWVPYLPLILGAWHHTSDEEKAERLAYHIHWAAERGALESVDGYLRGLPPEEWLR